MPKLVATKAKPLRLSGRRVYQRGDEFEVRTTAEARALKAIGVAKDYVEPAVDRDIERDALRQQAEAQGIEVDGRWGTPRLQEEIAAAKPARPGHYQRRDMRAEGEEE